MAKFAFAVLVFLSISNYAKALGTDTSRCCGGPIEINARKLYDFLKNQKLDELSAEKSDPNLCEKINCQGLETPVAQKCSRKCYGATSL